MILILFSSECVHVLYLDLSATLTVLLLLLLLLNDQLVDHERNIIIVVLKEEKLVGRVGRGLGKGRGNWVILGMGEVRTTEALKEKDVMATAVVLDLVVI